MEFSSFRGWPHRYDPQERVVGYTLFEDGGAVEEHVPGGSFAQRLPQCDRAVKCCYRGRSWLAVRVRSVLLTIRG